MIHSLRITLLTAISAVVFISCGAGQEPAPTTDGQVLGVDQLMHHTAQYEDDITVKGVVSGVSADEQLFTMIDMKEFQECGVTNCASLYLPVRWSGAAPAVQEAVTAHGRIEEVDGKLVFLASSVIKDSIAQDTP